MVIGIDYDDTITLDRGFWLAFYFMARAAGHEVYVTTMRYEHEPIDDFPGMIYYTGRKAKKPFMEALGIKIDVWIDDRPEFIDNDSEGI